MDEFSGETGNSFSEMVCQQWEACFNSIDTPQTRKLFLRISIVLGNEGGALGPLMQLARFGLGGRQGSGDQYVSWLHIADFAGIVQWLMEHEEMSGAVNCVSPRPVRNAEFMRVLRDVCCQPVGIPLPRILLEIGAVLIQTETELILKSRKVVPARLNKAGYHFKFAGLYEALVDLVMDKKKNKAALEPEQDRIYRELVNINSMLRFKKSRYKIFG